jgi:DNA-binding XRE family transcriptional regulator
MTPQQLIETAMFLNAEKLKSQPAEALRDALAFTEALRMVETSPAPNQLAAHPKEGGNFEQPVITASSNSNPIDQLRNFRKQNHMSTATLAKALGVHPGTLYFWLSGKYEPRRESFDKIVTFLKRNESKG